MGARRQAYVRIEATIDLSMPNMTTRGSKNCDSTQDQLASRSVSSKRLKIRPPKPLMTSKTPKTPPPIDEVDLTSEPSSPKPLKPVKPPKASSKQFSPSPPDLEVSYDLGITLVFDVKPIHNLRKLVHIREFNYDDWTAQEVIKASQYADKQGWQSHRVSGKAVLTVLGHRLVKKTATMDIDCSNEWDELQELIRHYYSMKRTDISVELTVTYGHRKDSEIDK